MLTQQNNFSILFETESRASTIRLRKADIVKLAKSPMVKVDPSASVQEVTERMAGAGTEAAIVVSAGRVIGIFTAKDLVMRVVAPRLSLSETAVADVMSSPVKAIVQNSPPEESEGMLTYDHMVYLPVLDREGRPISVVSALNLLRKHVEDLDRVNEVLLAYVSADGIGG